MAVKILPLKKKADFVKASKKGKAFFAPGFILQCLASEQGGNIRLGFTVSRKVGSAVERNRVKRRLRHASTRVFTVNARPDHDYVLIGRKSALKLSYDDLVKDMKKSLDKLHS